MAHARSMGMAKPTPPPAECLTSSPEAVDDLPDRSFLESWRLITGEPPAILLDSRAEMLALLVESTPEVTLEPTLPARDEPDTSDRTAGYGAEGGS